MSATLAGCGTDRPSAEPASAAPSAAAAASQSPYVGQPLPGLTPERFAPGLVSTDAIELNGVFSPDLREFYFTRVVNGVDTMHQIVFADGRWGSPRELLLFPNRVRAEAADMVLSHAPIFRPSIRKRLLQQFQSKHRGGGGFHRDGRVGPLAYFDDG